MTTHPDAAIDDLADRLLGLYMESEPLEASLLGIREHDAHLSDLSREHELSLADHTARLRDLARETDPDQLSPQGAVTRLVIIAQSEYLDSQRMAETLDYTVAAFPVSPSSIALAYVRMVVITNEQQAHDYLQRLREIPRYLEQAEQRLAEGRERGLTPVAHLVSMAIDQIDMFLTADPNPMAIAAPAKWVGVDQWCKERDDIIDRVVKPAFEAHRGHLASVVQPGARSADVPGLVHLPDGAARYRSLVRFHTTTERTPDELHQTGLRLIERIHAEFAELGAEIFGTSDVRDIFVRLNEDPALRWESAQQLIDAAEAAVRRAETASVDWFGRTPEAVCVLDQIPELEAEGSAPAYYMQPALDGSRPGTYYSNVNRPEERTSFDLEATAFHEAVPGHHFQISISLETPGLPLLRRMSFFTAYVEGWGLYSERLADEMGLYSSPIQRMGMLSADAWRASRLVVDTGLHAFGWTRQQAVDYMVANTPVARIDIEAEVDRYIAMPAQALSYMTGRLEIEALRSRATAALGDAFAIKAFHDTVLAAGALPLAVLGDLVDEWIRLGGPPVAL
jgi:uncharacterized protein (DUF885 family)